MGVRSLNRRGPFLGSSSWTPLSLGASLIAWWDAERSDLITHSSGAVSSWRDVVGGYNLTQATGTAQPIWNATSFVGRPGITPDGVDDFLELASPSFLPSGAAPSEDWHLVDQIALPADATLWALGAWGSTTNANSRTVFRNVVTAVNRLVCNVTNSQNNLLADFSGRHVVRHMVSATGHASEIDGLATTEFAVVPTTVAARIRTFANANTTVGSFSKAILNTRIITGPLTIEQANQLRAWLTARMPSFDSDVMAWVASVTANGGITTQARIALVNTMITGWKAAGIWDLIDDAWLLVAENEPQALTSLKQRRLATAVNSPAFTVDRGYAFSGTAYLDTGFVPSVNFVAMTGTSMHIAVYERTNLLSNNIAAGCIQSGSANLVISPRNGTGTISLRLSSTATGPGGDVFADSRGFSVGSRNGTLVSDIVAYKNGVVAVPFTPTAPGTALSNRPLYIGANNNVGTAASFRATTGGFVSAGADIPAGQQPAFYNAVQSFMTSVGANV